MTDWQQGCIGRLSLWYIRLDSFTDLSPGAESLGGVALVIKCCLHVLSFRGRCSGGSAGPRQ